MYSNFALVILKKKVVTKHLNINRKRLRKMKKSNSQSRAIAQWDAGSAKKTNLSFNINHVKFVGAICDFFDNENSIKKYQVEPLVNLLIDELDKVKVKKAENDNKDKDSNDESTDESETNEDLLNTSLDSASSAEAENIKADCNALLSMRIEINQTGGDNHLSKEETMLLRDRTIDCLLDNKLMIKLFSIFQELHLNKFKLAKFIE